jgi:anti-anti-sigma factor
MIRAGDKAAVLTIDVEGPATMMESTAVQDEVSECLLEGVRTLRVDLRDCTAMDSTFSGTLLCLKRQLDKIGGTLTLVSPSPKVIELLGQMGLEDFYAIDVADRTDAAWRKITPAHAGVEELRRAVIHAHDELARRPGPAAQTFREVVEELRRDGPVTPPCPRSPIADGPGDGHPRN